MNKIFKYLIGIGAIFTIGINLCNANGDLIYHGTGNYITRQTSMNGYSDGKNLCVNMINGTMHYDTGQGLTQLNKYDLYCFTGGSITLYPNNGTLTYNYVDLSLGCPTCPTCEICEEQYTSLECQQEYSLIPLSSVTASYCELNFNLIDPASCPINEGTGVVNWSSLFINNTQYAGNDNIEIFIPDFIGWSIIYNSGTNYIDIEGYNADEDYINTIIDNTKVTPTPEDATTLAQGLTEFIPYIFISMIVLYTLYLITKLFKS